MRQVQVVAALHQVVGELVAQGVAEPVRPVVIADQVEPDQLRFLAGVLGEGR